MTDPLTDSLLLLFSEKVRERKDPVSAVTEVNEQLRLKGHPARYSHGMRITDEVALDCAQEAAGQLRYEIEAAFSMGLPNTPMAGATVRVISGNFLTARPVGIVDGQPRGDGLRRR